MQDKSVENSQNAEFTHPHPAGCELCEAKTPSARERALRVVPQARESALSGKVFAIDSIYATFTPHTKCENIAFEADFFALLERQSVDLVFMSDVLHHLSSEFRTKLLQSAASVPFVVIKDIDARHKFGNFMNATHDLLINGERVQSVYPQHLREFFTQNGYKSEYFYLPKLWYPHFLLVFRKD